MRATFEQNGEFIALAGREAREEAQRLLARLEILIAGLSAKDPHAGLELRRAAVEFLVASGDQSARAEGRLSVVSSQRQGGATDRSGELESILLELIEGEEGGMHVDAISELLNEMGVEMTKGNLSVKLHRMIKAGRLISTARGCYGLSAMERARRMAG